MSTMTIIKNNTIQNSTLEPVGMRSGADKGSPEMSLLEFAKNAKGDIGIWECEPGGWPVIDRPNTEFCYILSGKATLTDELSREIISVSAGDLIILPIGWTGRWDIVEKVRKIYTIY